VCGCAPVCGWGFSCRPDTRGNQKIHVGVAMILCVGSIAAGGRTGEEKSPAGMVVVANKCYPAAASIRSINQNILYYQLIFDSI
jgi:hypothetical protein